MTSRTDVIRRGARDFCAAVMAAKPPVEVLSSHMIVDQGDGSSATYRPRITEHGPSWSQARLPFLAKTFTGHEECLKYFEILTEILEFGPVEDPVPPSDAFVADENAVVHDIADDKQSGKRGVVNVVFNSAFKSKKTGKSWKETFIYRLSAFDEEGRVGHWEIWADPLSAWEAVGG